MIYYPQPSVLDRYINEARKIDEDEWCIAGGAIREYLTPKEKQQPTDIDVFVFSRDTYKKLSGLVNAREAGEYLSRGRFENTKVDLILKENYTPQDVVGEFDFKCCMAYYYKYEIHYTSEVLAQILNKELYINKINNPLSLMRRLVQYGAKGYKMNKQTAADIVDFIHTLPDNYSLTYQFSDTYDNYDF